MGQGLPVKSNPVISALNPAGLVGCLLFWDEHLDSLNALPIFRYLPNFPWNLQIMVENVIG